MSDSNRLTPPAGEPVPNPLFDIAVTLAPDEVPQNRQTFTFTPPSEPGTRTVPPDGNPDTNTYTGPHPAAGHVRTHLPGYDILGVLGRGGMGVVYRARQVKLNRVVALKLMLHADHASPTTRGRFATEAQAVAKLQHPNIVQVFEVGEVDGVPFFSLEYVPGGTLAARVAEHLLPPRDAAALVASLAAAVEYAHAQGIVHRDLKPTNILLANAEFGTRNSESQSAPASGSSAVDSAFRIPHSALLPKIADFGLAKSLSDDSGITRSGSVVGTPSYMPPEQAAGDTAAVGPAADIYSLGAVLYELLAGRPPFKGANVAETLEQVRHAHPTPPSSLQAGVPRDLETICLKCLRKEPAQRYATAGELADDIGRYLRGEPILARPVGKVERAWRWCKRNPGVASLLGTVALLLACISVGASVAAVRINQKRNEAAHHRKVAEDRLKVYQKAVDGFVNEAPGILDGHPLGSTVAQDLLDLSAKLLRDVQDTGVDDSGLGKRGEMSAILRKAHLARGAGRQEEAAKLYDQAYKMGEELLAATSPEEKGKNSGNFALLVGQRANVARTAAETRVGWGEKPKARELFADAVKLHQEAIALHRRVATEPDMRDIPVGEAQCWLAGSLLDLAETHRASEFADDDDAGRRAAREAWRAAAADAEDAYAAGLAAGGFERALGRMRMRHAVAAWERAKAADKLDRDDEADAAYRRGFDLFKELVRDTPKNFLHRIEFAKLAAEQTHFLVVKRGDPKRAQAAAAAAAEQYRRVARPMELSHHRDSLGGSLYRAGVVAHEAGDAAAARDLFRLCVEAHEEQVREAVRMSSEKSLYTVSPRTRLMFAQARAGDHARAAAYAAELRQNWDKAADKLSYAAQGFALASAATDDGDLEAAYRDKAFDALSRAAEVGHANVLEVERDPDYAPLRGDPRFAPLLEKVKANAAAKK